MTDKRFECPECTAVLNETAPGTIEMLGVLRGPGFQVTVPIGIPSELGSYGAEVDENVVLEQGCLVDFACPHCGKDFTTAYDSRWAELKMVDGEHEYVVVFNKVYGRTSSFLFDYGTRKLVASYGDATEDYVASFGKNINFFGS